MQNTIVAVIILIALIVFLGINAAYINKINDEIRALYHSFPQTKADFTTENASVVALCEYWNRHRGYLTASISFFEIERMDEVVAELLASLDCANYDNFCAARERLEYILDLLTAGERLRLENIF